MRDFGFRAWLLRVPVPARTRGRLLRRFGATIGANVRVHPLTIVDAGWANLIVEDDVYLGHDCILDLSAPLTFRQGAVVAAGVAIVTHIDAGAAHNSPTAERLGTTSTPVTIGQYAFIGTHATILADVGDQSIVGAGAVVTKPVPAGLLVVGVPAK